MQLAYKLLVMQKNQTATRMTDKNLAELKIDSLDKRTFEQLQAQTVVAVLLALGSNYKAEHHLPRIRKQLAMLGEVQFSTAFQNPDFTATSYQPKPEYTNQCAYLSLNTPMSLQDLQHIFKQFEGECGRQRLSESQILVREVTMDIDILLVNVNSQKNSLSKNWIIITNRYPFKTHERKGVEELM